jgi:folate-binding protein YgfZ
MHYGEDDASVAAVAASVAAEQQAAPAQPTPAQPTPGQPLPTQALQPQGAEPALGVAMVAACGPIELEFAALRKGCGLFDEAHRAVLELRGPDAMEFLNRMLTQELKGVASGQVRRSFWLNRKGRIDADVRVTCLGDRVLLDVDVLASRRMHKGLGAFIITEDCELVDASQALHVLGLHGPTAWDVLRAASSDAALVGVQHLAKDTALETTIAGARVVVSRDDIVGEVGLHLCVPSASAVAVAQAIIAAGHDPHHHEPADSPGRALRVLHSGGRGLGLHLVGWHAINLARLEAGTPIYNIDFGPQSLPAETGVLHDRVSMTKGCYLGQEVVARMHARGQAKQVLCTIKFESVFEPGRDGGRDDAGAHQSAYPLAPEAPAPVALADKPDEVLGTLTSVGYAPTLGFAPVAFCACKPALAVPGAVVVVPATRDDGTACTLRGVVQAGLAPGKSAG